MTQEERTAQSDPGESVVADGNGHVRHVTVGDKADGQRIDNFLLALNRALPKSLIYKLLRKGDVRVNKRRVKPTYRVQAGDVVRIPPVGILEEGGRKVSAPPMVVDDWVIHEDNRLLVLNKPAGLAVHGGSGVSYGLVEVVRTARSDCPDIELAHRLDRDTSGVLLLCKKGAALRQVQKAMQAETAAKCYLCIVHGRFPAGETRVDAPLHKFALPSGERIVRVSREGKPSATRFRRLAATADFSLVEARLETGRTHQIRVHAAHLGFPVVGDKKYGNRQRDESITGIDHHKMFLHALSLQLELDGEVVRYVAEPPAHWSSLCVVNRQTGDVQAGAVFG